MKKFISLLLASLIFTLPLYGQSQSPREDKVFRALLNKGVNACLSNGAPILGEDISRGSTPLIIAAQLGDTALVKELLAKGADINARNAWNWTALFEAAEQGHSEAVFGSVDKTLQSRPKIRSIEQRPRIGVEAFPKALHHAGPALHKLKVADAEEYFSTL